MSYAWYATTYGWTPEQVDRLPQFLADRLPDYQEILVDVQNEASDRTERIRRAKERRGG